MILDESTSVEREAELLRTIAHPIRLAILEALTSGEECVCHLSTYVDKPQPYVSKHLAELREAGLVLDRRDAQRVYYRLNDDRVRLLIDAARSLTGRPPAVGRRRLADCPCPRCT